MKFWWSSNDKADSILAFQKQLEKQREEFNAEIMLFAGVDGSIKGRSLIRTEKKNADADLFAGMMTENFRDLKKTGIVFSMDNLKLNLTHFEEGVMVFKSINEKVMFAALLRDTREVKSLRKWLKKTKTELTELFKEKKP